MALESSAALILERTTAFWSGVLKDQDGNVIPSAALSALKLTHMVKDDNTPFTLINSRDHQNVLNANNVTVDSAGLVTWEMLPVDNLINDNAGISHVNEEPHVSVLEFEWLAGARAGKHVINTTIVQLERQPT